MSMKLIVLKSCLIIETDFTSKTTKSSDMRFQRKFLRIWRKDIYLMLNFKQLRSWTDLLNYWIRQSEVILSRSFCLGVLVVNWQKLKFWKVFVSLSLFRFMVFESWGVGLLIRCSFKVYFTCAQDQGICSQTQPSWSIFMESHYGYSIFIFIHPPFTQFKLFT